MYLLAVMVAVFRMMRLLVRERARKKISLYVSYNLLSPVVMFNRKFVEQELFKPDEVPERHNLSFFPTVNDIKNHIHEVQKTLKNGKVVYDSETIPATVILASSFFSLFL